MGRFLITAKFTMEDGTVFTDIEGTLITKTKEMLEEWEVDLHESPIRDPKHIESNASVELDNGYQGVGLFTAFDKFQGSGVLTPKFES